MHRYDQGTAPTRVHPHTNVDHRQRGPDVEILAGKTWIAIAEFTARPDRQEAVISAVETRIELFRQKHHVAPSFLIASRDGHRVIAFLGVSGHDEFRELQSAWDQHEQHLARTDKAEASKLVLCHCTATSGDPTFSVGSTDVLTFDAFESEIKPAADALADTNDEILGTALLRDDTSTHSFFLTRRTTVPAKGTRRYHVVRSWEKS
ncbi:MAG: hypothetical protein WCE44_13585 [Candidatus Velthaea sp.]|jgi:hypothetical protein